MQGHFQDQNVNFKVKVKCSKIYNLKRKKGICVIPLFAVIFTGKSISNTILMHLSNDFNDSL